MPFSHDAWKISAQESRIEEFQGRETLWLKDGTAILPDVAFEDGVLEFDLMTDGQRGFSGAVWRWVEGKSHEHFYVRPHQSGKTDAMQYQPVLNGVGGWQIYTDPSHCGATMIPVDEWVHVRIEVAGDRGRVFLDDREVLVMGDLGCTSTAGGLGLSSGFAPGRFADFRFTRTVDFDIAEPSGIAPRLDGPGLVRHWKVSTAFPESTLQGVDQLDEARVASLAWHGLEVEPNGIANLARIQPAAPANTALARIVLEAQGSTTQRLDFGFSDRVRLFHDGELLFAADDTYVTRDYRFLGTVGLYDSVYLRLHPGRNVIDLAVSESFGGWAAAARLEPREGVRMLSE